MADNEILPEISTEKLLAEYRICLHTIATGGQSYTIGDRTFSRPDVQKVMDIIKQLTELVNAEAGTRPIIQTFDLSGMGYGGL